MRKQAVSVTKRGIEKKEGSVMYKVNILYHPQDPDSLERQYPEHLKLAKPLIDAALHCYAGPAGGEVGGKKVTRDAIFIFESR